MLIAVVLGMLAMFAVPAAAGAKAKDRNHDRIPDRWEKRHHLSLHVKQGRHDQDRDHLRNMAEFQAGDNPRDRDSDNDGIMDGEENAGTIQAFDVGTGKLTIALFGGDTVSGTVTEETEIKCQGGHDGSASASDDGEEHGDDPGDDNQGEDHSGPGSGEEHGDDPGDDDQGEDHSGPGSGDPVCGVDKLVEGAVVEEADLKLANGTAVFEEVELAG